MFAELTAVFASAGWVTTATAATAYRRRLHTDELTGIGNRRALYRNAARARRGLMGLLMVDLDRFKAINDTYGHAFGNKVLAAVATRLADTAQPGEHAVRLHGDEFALWLGHMPSPAHAERRARAVSKALAAPLSVEGHRLSALGSVGLALAPAGTPLGALLGQADRHMYQVKHTRRLTVLPTGRPRRVRDTAPGGGGA